MGVFLSFFLYFHKVLILSFYFFSLLGRWKLLEILCYIHKIARKENKYNTKKDPWQHTHTHTSHGSHTPRRSRAWRVRILQNMKSCGLLAPRCHETLVQRRRRRPRRRGARRESSKTRRVSVVVLRAPTSVVLRTTTLTRVTLHVTCRAKGVTSHVLTIRMMWCFGVLEDSTRRQRQIDT